MIAATGEQVSVGLLSMALQAIGKDSRVLRGWQVGIKTDSAFTKARIQSIDDARVLKDLEEARSSSSPASRAWTRTATSPPWAAAARTLRPWRLPPR
jgi:hypothetical protein